MGSPYVAGLPAAFVDTGGVKMPWEIYRPLTQLVCGVHSHRGG